MEEQERLNKGGDMFEFWFYWPSDIKQNIQMHEKKIAEVNRTFTRSEYPLSLP